VIQDHAIVEGQHYITKFNCRNNALPIIDFCESRLGGVLAHRRYVDRFCFCV
jgi:hypothetical protein